MEELETGESESVFQLKKRLALSGLQIRATMELSPHPHYIRTSGRKCIPHRKCRFVRLVLNSCLMSLHFCQVHPYHRSCQMRWVWNILPSMDYVRKWFSSALLRDTSTVTFCLL